MKSEIGLFKRYGFSPIYLNSMNSYFFWGKNRRKFKSRLLMLKALLDLLPTELSFLRKQLDEGITLEFVDFTRPGTVFWKIVHDKVLAGKYKSQRGDWYSIKGVFVKDSSIGVSRPIVLEVNHSILRGFYFPGVRDFEPAIIEVGGCPFIEKIGNADYEKLKTILLPGEDKYIEQDDVYVINLYGRDYFHLVELGDGDFFAMSMDRHFYKITHDPMEVVELPQAWKFLSENGRG